MEVSQNNLTAILELPKEQRLRLFREQLAKVTPHMPDDYGAFTRREFPHLKTKKGRTHMYNVKLYGSEDWELLFFWQRLFVPAQTLAAA
ncbi:hypothetical protein [Hymenobacter sp. YC55]|uniref:hypothetical protein n=1 Tax=Hymenobacter sp. YC55 TaxID=3034019 RepID=UPI0023F8B359|nr:hypothetical protein [Hymenobacter sp. YC55]MDF7809949.1 hypothetical protein [Hymenobacter sp. YC55]